MSLVKEHPRLYSEVLNRPLRRHRHLPWSPDTQSVNYCLPGRSRRVSQLVNIDYRRRMFRGRGSPV